MKKRTKIIGAALILTAIIIVSLVTIYQIKKRAKNNRDTNSQIEKLLSQSSNYLGSSIELASKKANEALMLSKKSNDIESIIQSMQLLAEVKNIEGETEQALKYYSEAYELALKNQLQFDVCKITIEIGKIYYNWGKYDTALEYFQKAIDIAKKNNEKQLTSQALYYMGKYYHTKGNFDEAMSYFQQALEIARQTSDYKQIVITLNTQGKYFIADGDLTAALQCYQEAYDASEQMNDKLLIASTCNHLGGLYLQTEQYEKALEYHRKALCYRDTMNSLEGIAKSYNNIGKAFFELDKIDSAQFYFEKSLDLCKKTAYKKGLVKALTNMGRINMIRKNHNASEQLLLQAFNIAKKSGYSMGVAETSQALGNLYKSDSLFKKALPYFEMSRAHLQKLDFDQLMRINYQGLYECYKALGDYNSALLCHELLLETEKKLLNVENSKQLAILQITYNSERKEKDNQVLRKDNELKEMTIRRKTTLLWLIVALLFSTILLCLYIYNRFYSKIKANQKLKILNSKVTSQNQTLEKLNKELNEANKEKDKLFSIIAHELRNPLYWFQNLAEVLSKNHQTMKPDKIQKSLVALDESAKNAFHLMDNLLHWSRSRLNRITTKKESYNLKSLILESVKMYETIIQHKEIDLQFSIDNETNIFVDSNLFSCVIRNLVSNAIKFTPTKGTISIECIDNFELKTIIVSDSGTGIALENFEDLFSGEAYSSNLGLMQEKGSGLGLKLCKEFVELSGGTIWLSNNHEKGTRFMFTVPKS